MINTYSAVRIATMVGIATRTRDTIFVPFVKCVLWCWVNSLWCVGVRYNDTLIFILPDQELGRTAYPYHRVSDSSFKTHTGMHWEYVRVCIEICCVRLCQMWEISSCGIERRSWTGHHNGTTLTPYRHHFDTMLTLY